MCLTPIRLPDGQKVACGVCSWCRANRVKDFVGRCLAEMAVSSAVYAVTLTYSGDVVNATSLYYVDVQRMLYRLRNDGFSVRYICAGEHGERKGRAHWHIVLFFVGKCPAFPLESRVEWEYWPHGFVYAQTADYAGFRYLLKYTLKDNKGQRGFKKVLRLSKKPPLGSLYFEGLAQRLVDARLAVHSPEYSFADVLGYEDGFMKPRKFWLVNRSLELFLEAYCRKWQLATGGNPPDTELLWEKVYDPIAKRERDLSTVDMGEQVEARKMVAREYAKRQALAAGGLTVHTGLLLLPPDGLLATYSDGSAVLVWENSPWQLSVSGNGAASVSIQLLRAGLPPGLASVAVSWLFPDDASVSLSRPPSITDSRGWARLAPARARRE